MNTCTYVWHKNSLTSVRFTRVYIMGQICSISDIYRAKLVHAHLSVTVTVVALSGTNMYLAVCTLEVILLWPLLTQTLTDAKRWCQISKICRVRVKAKHAGTHSYWEHQQSNCIKESRKQKNTHTLKFSQWNQTKSRFKGDKVQMYIHVHVYWNIGGNWIWQCSSIGGSDLVVLYGIAITKICESEN